MKEDVSEFEEGWELFMDNKFHLKKKEKRIINRSSTCESYVLFFNSRYEPYITSNDIKFMKLRNIHIAFQRNRSETTLTIIGDVKPLKHIWKRDILILILRAENRLKKLEPGEINNVHC